MDEDSNSNPPPNRPFRIRRPSSSLISSTTSPIFPVPPNPLLRSSINRGASTSSSAFQLQRDGDEDIAPSSPTSSSSSMSFTAPSSRQQRAGFNFSNVNASTSSNSFNNTRSTSPLGSPDSTFWGRSSPGPLNFNHYRGSSGVSSNNNSSSNNNNAGESISLRGPPTPGGMCVVSSSTIEDDIPPSPFSPAQIPEDHNNINTNSTIRGQNGTCPRGSSNNSGNVNNSVSVISGSNINCNNGNQPGSIVINRQESVSLSPGPTSSQETVGKSLNEANQGEGQYSNFSSPSSSYLSPLGKKIKKASSFERFSAQAQASINNSNNSSGNTQNEASNDSRINVTHSTGNKYSSQVTASASSGPPVPGPSRLMWEYLPRTTSNSTSPSVPAGNSLLFSKSTSVINGSSTIGNNSAATATTTQNESAVSASTSTSTTSSIPLQFNSKPFLIKKYAAKIASDLEQKQLEQASSSINSASTSQFPSIRNNLNLQSGSSIVDDGPPLVHEKLSLELNANSPLNLTENASAITTTATTVVRIPIAKTFSKKIPMPPKQKILQRMQSGEVFDGLSPPPPSIPSFPPPAPISPPHSSRPAPQLLQSQLLQEQLVLPSLHQQQQLLHEPLQQHQQSDNDNNISLQQQQSMMERYNAVSNYDSFGRSSSNVTNNNSGGGSDDFSCVQDVLTKANIDCNADPSNIVLYDDVADAYAYYYGNILGDEIFSNTTGGNCSTSSSLNSRPLIMMQPSNSNSNMELHDEMGNIFQSNQHGHLEFALGLNPSTGSEDDDSLQQHDRIMSGSRDVDELQLNEVGIDGGSGNVGAGPSSQVQFLDPNETSNSLSKLQNDSTLRNLLMMQPLRNHDDSWITASNEYQNSLRGLNSGGLGGLPTNSILGNALLMNVMGNTNNSSNTNWINDWPPRSLWQQQQQHSQHDQQTDDDSGGDQDEVMDMSVMDIDKTHNMNLSNSSSIIIKRGTHPHTLDNHGAENLSLDDVELVSERELAASSMNLPSLQGIPLDLQLQQQVHQQPLSLNMFGKNQNSLLDTSCLSSQSDPSFIKNQLAIDSQQHHRTLSMDNDEPVNLIATTNNSDQEFIHQHHRHHNSSHHLNDGSTACIVNSQDPNNACMTILTTTSSTTLTTSGPVNFGNGFDNILNGTIEDKQRIIRYKKLKTTMSESSNSKSNGSNLSPLTANFIPDKPVQPKAFGSLPSPLNLIQDETNCWRVFNRNKIIPYNTRFGPVEGPMKKVYEDDLLNVPTSTYPYLVMVDENSVLWHLDRTHDELCNWMKFIRLARNSQEQNALISECNDLIYFTTCKNILPKTELKVGYSLEYAEKYGFPYIEADYDNFTEDADMDYETESVATVGKEKATKVVEVFQCFECDTEFSKPEDLTLHLNTAHNDEPDELSRRPKKKALKKYYNSENITPYTGQNKPEENGTTITVVKISSGSFPGISTSKSTLPHQDASCNSCGIEFSKQAIVDKHGKLQSGVTKEVIGSKYEKFPRKKAAMENALHDSGNSTANNNEIFTNKPMVASSTISTTAVSAVVKKKNKCLMCYKSFATKDRLERHMIVHSDDESKPLKCPSCDKRFLTNSALAGHVKTHAEEGKCFECPLCEFSTQQLLQLKAHVQTHRNQHTGMFHCNRCVKKFAVYAMVRKHVRAFHGPRSFSCDYDQCPMTFPTSDKLKLHKLKHSDHREFLCAECGRQFKRRDKLVEHTKRMHSGVKKRPVEIQIIPTPPAAKKARLHKKFIPKLSPEEFEKFTYRCADCVIGFKRRGMLVNHLAKRHPEKTLEHVAELNLPILKTTRNYFCLYCERVYKSSSKRKSHILKSHPGKELPPQLRGKVFAKAKEQEESSNNSTLKSDPTASGNSDHGNFVSSDENGVSASGIQVKRMSLFNDAGKVVATPHACQWCHRQYATRAKLLQHQRKSHLHLMPPDMQTPRTQKNNVQKNQLSLEIPNLSLSTTQNPVSKIQQVLKSVNNMESSDSNSQVSGSDEVIGFFLTTNISNGELNSLLQLQQSQELVVVPMTSLGTTTINNEALASITSTTNNNNALSLTPVTTTASVPRVSTIYSTHIQSNSQQNNNNLVNQVVSNELNVSSGSSTLTKATD